MKWTGVTSRVSSSYLNEKVGIYVRQLIQTRTRQRTIKMKFSLLFVSALAFNEDLNPSKEVNLISLIWKYYQKKAILEIFSKHQDGIWFENFDPRIIIIRTILNWRCKLLIICTIISVRTRMFWNEKQNDEFSSLSSNHRILVDIRMYQK